MYNNEVHDRFDTYLGNPFIKRDGVVQSYTKEQVNELIKCRASPVYFCKNYLKVIDLDRGLVDFTLYPYQEKMFDHFENNRFSIVLAVRQSGKSIAAVGYLAWYLLFHESKKVIILANKGATAREMLARLTLMLENVPFFLQPGCKTLNKGSILFSNNSEIRAESTSSNSVRGFSANIILLDEFAFVKDAAKFYTSTYPVISSGKTTKVIITSTANGLGNQFHKIWEGALQGTNEFKPLRVDWWDVPGRDEKWKESTIANTSKLQFDQEFGNKFIGAGDTLIDGETLLGLRSKQPKNTTKDGVLIYEETNPKHEYIMTVDVAKGRGQDYSTFNIIDISVNPFRQVAVYRNNKISPLLLPNILFKYATAYNEAYVIIEANDQGYMVCNGLYNDLEYENMHLESAIKADRMGVEMTRKVKRIGCTGFKDILENNKLDLVDEETIKEVSTFEAKGSSYEATPGNHDDLVMNLVLFGYFASTTSFSEMTDINIKDMLFKQRMKDIENDVVPFGIVDDGLSDLENNIEVPDVWSIGYINDAY